MPVKLPFGLAGQRRRGRLLSKIRVRDNGCWEWTGSPDGNGVGQFRLGVRVLSAPRPVVQFFAKNAVTVWAEHDNAAGAGKARA